MTNKKITIIHPSRQRPLMAFETYNKWITNALNIPEVEYILSVDNDDPTLQQYNWEFRGAIDVTFQYNNNRSAIDAINVAAKNAKGDLFVVVSDDFDAFFGWNQFLHENLKDKRDFIVKTNETHDKKLKSLSRVWKENSIVGLLIGNIFSKRKLSP